MDLTRMEDRITLAKLFAVHGATLAYSLGSHADEMAGPLSDLDFAALLGPEVPRAEWSDRQLSLMGALMHRSGRDQVALLILNRATPILAQQVAQHGRVLLEAYPGARASFQVAILHRYEDTKPLRRIHDRCFLDHIKEDQSLVKRVQDNDGRPNHLGIILDRLQALHGYVGLLQPYAGWSIRRLTENRIRYGGVLHHLQWSSQIVLDVSAHLNAELGLGRVSEYRQSVHNLGAAGILPQEFADRVADLADFRNVLVHQYLTVDPLKVQEALESGLADLRAFIVYVIDYLKEEGYLPRE